MTIISLHPLKEGILSLLHKHFSDDIVKNFVLAFEKDIYNKESPHIWKQVKENVLILEVRYKVAEDTYVYICDLRSDWSRKFTEYQLLKYITDKYKEGKIRFDTESFTDLVKSGAYETPTDAIYAKEAKQMKEARLDMTGRKYKLQPKRVN